MLKGFQEHLSILYDIISPWEVFDRSTVSGISVNTVEIADRLWEFSACASVAQVRKRWIKDILRNRQEPMKKVARMVLKYLNGIAVAALTGDQRTRRVIEREDSESLADGTWLPQHGVVQERHLLPLWCSVNVP